MELKRRLKSVCVVVEAEEPWLTSPETQDEQMVERCKEIARSIRRHVDHVAAARVEQKWIKVCPFCDQEYETETSGEPLCCTAAHERWEKELLAKEDSENKLLEAYRKDHRDG